MKHTVVEALFSRQEYLADCAAVPKSYTITNHESGFGTMGWAFQAAVSDAAAAVWIKGADDGEEDLLRVAYVYDRFDNAMKRYIGFAHRERDAEADPALRGRQCLAARDLETLQQAEREGQVAWTRDRDYAVKEAVTQAIAQGEVVRSTIYDRDMDHLGERCAQYKKDAETAVGKEICAGSMISTHAFNLAQSALRSKLEREQRVELRVARDEAVGEALQLGEVVHFSQYSRAVEAQEHAADALRTAKEALKATTAQLEAARKESARSTSVMVASEIAAGRVVRQSTYAVGLADAVQQAVEYGTVFDRAAIDRMLEHQRKGMRKAVFAALGKETEDADTK